MPIARGVASAWSSSRPRLARALDGAGVAELTAELVRIPSHPGVARQEEGVARALGRYLEAGGLRPELVEVESGRPNLLCRVGGGRPGRHLLLCGHTDTVPLNAADPGEGLSGRVAGGVLHGRGAVDMKGGLAAMAAALVALHRSGALEEGAVTFAAVVDEELRSIGAEHLVKSGFTADGAIVGEATGNAVALGHKGIEWLEFDFIGKAAHGSLPAAGVNAIVAAARFIALAVERLEPRFAARAHALLGPPTMNFGVIAGGDQPSTVASSCTVRADRRSVPGEDYESIRAELRELLSEIEARTPGLRTRLRRDVGGMKTLEHVSCAIDAGHPLAAAARDALRAVGRKPAPARAFPAWSDAALLSTFAGIPSCVLGPGDLELAHSPHERVPLEELRAAARVYCETALRFCAAPADASKGKPAARQASTPPRSS